MRQKLLELCPDFEEIIETTAGSTVTSHCGPGTLGVLFLRQPGELVTAANLLREVWGPTFVTQTHYLRVYLAHLRKKLEPSPERPAHFITVPGVGYRFEP